MDCRWRPRGAGRQAARSWTFLSQVVVDQRVESILPKPEKSSIPGAQEAISGTPAGAVADSHVCAALDDALALDEMARTCAAVTVETENVPIPALQMLEQHLVLLPAAHCVAIAQDRIREKRFVSNLGLSPAPHIVVNTLSDLEDARSIALLPGVLKLSRLGYDGKGQANVSTPEEARVAFADRKSTRLNSSHRT